MSGYPSSPSAPPPPFCLLSFWEVALPALSSRSNRVPRAHSGWSIWRQLGNSCSKHSLADLSFSPFTIPVSSPYSETFSSAPHHDHKRGPTYSHLVFLVSMSLFLDDPWMIHPGNISVKGKMIWIYSLHHVISLASSLSPALSRLTSTLRWKPWTIFFHCLCLIWSQPINSLNMKSSTCSLSISQKYFLPHWLCPG